MDIGLWSCRHMHVLYCHNAFVHTAYTVMNSHDVKKEWSREIEARLPSGLTSYSQSENNQRLHLSRAT